MRRLLAILGTIAVAAGAAVLTGATGEEPTGKTYNVVFDNAFGLVEGGELKIGGVRAGTTTGFHLTDSEPAKVAVEVEVTKPGFDSLRQDATCAVRQQSLIGEYFVDCDLGRAKQELPNGGTVPVERTASTIPPDLIQNVLRRPYRERFRIILSELGTGLAGRPEELNEVIRRAHPALRETNQTFKLLADENRTIRDFIEDADTVSAAVEPKREDVAQWAREAEDTASIQASRHEELAQYWRTLPDFLGEARPTLAQLQDTANRQIPLLRRLRAAAPDLQRFFTELGPFARASRGATKALGQTSVIGRAALTESREEVAQLRALAEDAPELAKPLRQLLQTIDDRKRSIEFDPEAVAAAPPAPDKTSDAAGKGFTGMEAFWNYIYQQTLATNGFDQISHFLRILLVQNVSCSPYAQDVTTDSLRQRCSSWLGPTQPGLALTGDADPTASTRLRAAEQRERANPREQAGHRGAGEPEAPPLPGRIDPSKPRIVLPPQVQQLLDALPPLNAPQVPDLPRSKAPDELLDFLLGS